jgi:dTDP-glucose 4,6-dehydratase
MKVLITGSAGFIFSNFIIYALQETDWDLVSIDKLTYAGRLTNVPQVKRHKLYVGDICDKHFVSKILEVEKPEVIIHGAAESRVDSIKGSDEFIQTNVVGTHTMLAAALKLGVKKFINISTDKVYSTIKAGSFKEDDKLHPTNPYSASKASADLLGQSYYSTYGLPVVTTRCCNVFGPRQHVEKFIPKVIVNTLTNKKIPLYGKGDNIREWIYVKDQFYAIKALIQKGIPGEVYNISSGQERTNLQVIKSILKIANKSEDLIEYIKDRQGHDFRYSVDCSKLKALGWKAQFNFDEALEHTIGWLRANGYWFCGKQND